MLNLTNRVTITASTTTGTDPATGAPTLGSATVVDGARCHFRVLSALDHAQQWGDEPTTTTQAVLASLILPRYGTELVAPLDAYTITVDGYPDTWRVLAARPGELWTTYLVSASAG